MNIVIGIIIGALVVLFVPFSIAGLIGVLFVGAGVYFAPSEFLMAALAFVLIWFGLGLIF